MTAKRTGGEIFYDVAIAQWRYRDTGCPVCADIDLTRRPVARRVKATDWFHAFMVLCIVLAGMFLAMLLISMVAG